MNAGEIWHLIGRFLGSIRPGPPTPGDERWAESHLLADERELWRRMNNPDRRHAVEVARAVEAELGPKAERPVLAAALLHDSGKIESGFRTPARVFATLVWLVVDTANADRWRREASGLKHRLALYRLHPEIGAEFLNDAGSDPLTVAWAREHHRPADEWTVPAELASVLKACDDD